MTDRKKLDIPEGETFTKYMETTVSKIGIHNLIPLLPVSLGEIRNALEKGDKDLNTIPLPKWDEAAGFETDGCQCIRKESAFGALISHTFQKTISCSTSVCILKYAARKLATEERYKITTLPWANLYACLDTHTGKICEKGDGWAAVSESEEKIMKYAEEQNAKDNGLRQS